MSHAVKVSGVLITDGELDGDGRLDRRSVKAVFFVPLDGTRVDWHFDNNGAGRSLDVTTLEFQGPDIKALVDAARTDGRETLLTQLRAMSLDQITGMLTESADNNEDGW